MVKRNRNGPCRGSVSEKVTKKSWQKCVLLPLESRREKPFPCVHFIRNALASGVFVRFPLIVTSVSSGVGGVNVSVNVQRSILRSDPSMWVNLSLATWPFNKLGQFAVHVSVRREKHPRSPD